MAHMNLVRVDRQDGWARLVLNRPLLAELAAALTALAADAAIRAAVLSGSGEHFAAGADLAEVEAKSRAEAAMDPRKALWAEIRAFPKPLIAAVDGFALGGGLELALLADLLVAGATARLGLPESNLGLVPGAGGGQRLLARIGPARAARMVMMGEVIDAKTAYEWGLASHISDGPAAGIADELATRLAGRAPLALAAAKRALVAGGEAGLAFGAERTAFEQLLDSADKAEGIRAFREQRKPRFTGQ
jgi:enoyl-CoA hydratase